MGAPFFCPALVLGIEALLWALLLRILGVQLPYLLKTNSNDKLRRPETTASPTATKYSASKDGMSLKVKHAVVHLLTSWLWLTDFPCSEKGS